MGHPRNSAPERNDIIITASIIINISVIIIIISSSSSSSMTKCNSIICIIISSSIDLRMLSLLVSYPRSSARMGWKNTHSNDSSVRLLMILLD